MLYALRGRGTLPIVLCNIAAAAKTPTTMLIASKGDTRHIPPIAAPTRKARP